MTMTQRMTGGSVLLLMLLTAVDMRADEAEDKAVQALEKRGARSNAIRRRTGCRWLR